MYASIRNYLILCGLAIIFVFLGYSRYISKELEKETETITRIYGKFCSTATEDETNVIFEEVIRKINFPVVVTDKDGNVITSRNIENPTDRDIAGLDKINEPVKIEYNGEVLALVHYGNTKARQFLKWAPHAQIVLGIIIVVIAFLWHRTVQRTEENSIWTGIARETAHQLGTPISSVAGWIEHLQDNKIKSLISKDIDRLSNIASRLHKIGSPSKFEMGNLSNVTRETVEYLRNRISNKIKIIEKYDDKIELFFDRELISWSVENLLKNSVDAEAEEIEVSTNKENKYAQILVKDNGKGMSRKELRNAFNPGYTTKEYGWGFGLTLVKRITMLHKGKVFAKRENGHTVFTIRLPMKVC